MKFTLIKWPFLHEHFYQTKLRRFGFAILCMAAILDFQISIYQVFIELEGSNLVFKLITQDLLLGPIFASIIGCLVWQVYLWQLILTFKCLYPSGLKSFSVEIWILPFYSQINYWDWFLTLAAIFVFY